MIRKLLYIFSTIILLYSISIPCQASQFFENDDEIVIVIDPGHGGDNYGTTANENFKEKEITLKVANALVDELEKYDGVTVYMTREGDKDLSLTERAQFAANVDADMLFSLHFNASENHTMFGSEVWIPLDAPYHAMCYQFAHLQLQEMQDMGIYIRGIKTRKNERGTNYYGIIRDSVARDIPAVIIEHCYVDEERDLAFCSSDEMYEELGKKDARAIAIFLGLDDSLPGIPEEFLSLTSSDTIADTYEDPTGPDICSIETKVADYNNGLLTIEVTAADYNTPLVYYSYSLDGGNTFSKWMSWPGSDTLTGEYDDTFLLELEIPDGYSPQVILRAYNKFDIYTQSNVLLGFDTFHIPVQESSDPIIQEGTDTKPELHDVEVFVPKPSEDDFSLDLSMNTKRFILLFVFAVLWILLLLSATWFIRSILKNHKGRD